MMRRISCRSSHLRIFLTIFGVLLWASPSAYGQSLGDIARENRDKKEADASSTPPKVITNANLPKDPDAGAAPSASRSNTQTAPPASVQSSKTTAERAAEQRARQQRAAEEHAAEHWKRQILAQQHTIANLRMRVDRLKASIQFVDPNTSYDYYSGVALNRYQARQLERLAQMQQQLAEQKRRLENMQEAARRAGMHTAVYDP